MVITQEMAVLFFDLMIHFAESQTSYATFEILLHIYQIWLFETDADDERSMVIRNCFKSEFSAIRTYTVLYSSHLHLRVQIEYFIMNSKRKLNSINSMSHSKPLHLGKEEYYC